MLKFNSDGMSVDAGLAPPCVSGEHQGAKELKASTNNHAVLSNPHAENERAAGGYGKSAGGVLSRSQEGGGGRRWGRKLDEAPQHA